MTSNHEEAKAMLLVYLELEVLIQLSVAAQQWSQFHQVVWFSLHMLCHWNTVCNFASLPGLLEWEGLPLWACVYTGCTVAHFCGPFSTSCQILRFPLPEIGRWGEWRVMGWVKSKDGVCDDKGSRTGKCGGKWRRGKSWDFENAYKTQVLCVTEPPALPRQSSKQHYFCLVTINQ